MIPIAHLIPNTSLTLSPTGRSLLGKTLTYSVIVRYRKSIAGDPWRPRNQENRLKQVAEKYMKKMELKYNMRLQKRLNPKGVRLSEGFPPSLLTEIDEGLKSVLRKRQRVLDKIFMENVTEILSTNPIGDFIKENCVIFTQCEVTKNYHTLQIYYFCDKSKAKMVVTELNRFKETLRSLLTQKYIMGKIPTIEYMYDLSYDKNCLLTERMSSLDLGPKEEKEAAAAAAAAERENQEINRESGSPIRSQGIGGDGGGNDQFIPPKPDPEPFRRLKMSRRAKELTTFDPEYGFRYTHNPYDNLKASSRFLIFDHPDDMRLDTFSLDYKVIVNKILFNLVKNRSPNQAFNPVSQPLPPVDWSLVKPMARLPPDMNDPAQNFKGRVMTMRKFLIENRKKKQLLSREAKRLKEEMSLVASDNLNQAWENLGFNSPLSSATNISPLDDHEYLHSKLDLEEDN